MKSGVEREAVRAGWVGLLGFGVRGELLEVLLQRGIGLLGGGEVSGLEGLAELVEELADGVGGILVAAGVAGAVVMVMTVAVALEGGLEVLLNLGVVLLGGGEVARLQVAGELLEVLRDGVVVLC